MPRQFMTTRRKRRRVSRASPIGRRIGGAQRYFTVFKTFEKYKRELQPSFGLGVDVSSQSVAIQTSGRLARE
jgi:hypothetical protein